MGFLVRVFSRRWADGGGVLPPGAMFVPVPCPAGLEAAGDVKSEEERRCSPHESQEGDSIGPGVPAREMMVRILQPVLEVMMTRKSRICRLMVTALVSAVPWLAWGQTSDEESAGDGTCLEDVAKYFSSDDPMGSRDFNVKFDRNSDGNSFSCEPVMSASQARDALEAFRYGFLYESEEHLARSVHFPIPAKKRQTRSFDDEGVGTILKTPGELIEYKKQFNALQIATIACASLPTMYLAGWRGFFLGRPGMVWFEAMSGIGVRVTSISLMPPTTDWLLESCVSVQEREHLVDKRTRSDRLEEYLKELDDQTPEAKTDSQIR